MTALAFYVAGVGLSLAFLLARYREAPWVGALLALVWPLTLALGLIVVMGNDRRNDEGH
jgi:chromate transport protein ChrA